ncbi:MAG: hypothetical protein IJM52_03815, partial [Spirochaetales bacterium]|nr:hypothetical protein [Spirochaetales bacterium]
MRRKTTITILLLAVAFMAAASGDLTITYRQLKGSRVMNALLNTESIAYCISVRQDGDGRFSIEAPP